MTFGGRRKGLENATAYIEFERMKKEKTLKKLAWIENKNKSKEVEFGRKE